MRTKESNKKQGKANRASGADFEKRTRKDLQEKGWIVDKWSNNIDLIKNKLIPSKHKFRGMGIPMAIGTGFPDFIAFKFNKWIAKEYGKEINRVAKEAEIIGVECKVGKYLSKEEKEKCNWLLKNNIFSKIMIAYKDKEGRKIIVKYKEFKDGKC